MVVLLALLAVSITASPREAAAGPQITAVQSTGSVSQFDKLEISFQVTGSTATRMQWPYDPAPPNGLPAGVGITVKAVFTDPDGRQFEQPAFYSEQFLDEIRNGRDWHLPTGNFTWKVRFSPNRAGAWSYKIVAADAGGTSETSTYTFTVTASTKKGFVRVSPADARYFEFDDGTPFNGAGFELPDFLGSPSTRGATEYSNLAANAVNFVRVWISSMYGSAWSTWIGGRNQYGGNVPIAGMAPFYDSTNGQTTLTMKLDYSTAGDTGWFDACRMELWWDDQAESIKPNTTYRIRVNYHGEGITGPRNTSYANYGLIAKLDGDWTPNCHEPGTGIPITGYGGNNSGFSHIEGSWHSGTRNFLPRMLLGLENVVQGAAYVQSVSLREDLGNGNLGPEMMLEPSMEHHLYVPEEKAYSLDKVIENAERAGVYLKLVIMEKDDEIYNKMADDGSWATTDNRDGFYGLGRTVNKTRWLQQMWWRYLQARWGYSSNIHSWELTNEGDPASTTHYEMTDEFGKFMHCRVFGIEPGAGDGAACSLRHPNAHLVTTSFWHSFPAAEFWMNTRYPNVDYADVHAYVSTSFAPLAERQLMQWDAGYYHLWHSQRVASALIGKPVVRGEGGLDAPDQQSETVLGISRDTAGVWLHNFLWSALDAGAMYETYWWTSHIWNSNYDHRGEYKAVRAFLDGLPLNKGGYVDWGGSVTSGSLRVVGQKNASAGSMHLWVQNRQHTWKNVVDGVGIAPASGDIVVPGFRPGTSYTVQRWDTYAASGRIASTESVVADSSGSVRLTIASLQTDLALKLFSGLAPRPPTNVTIKK